MDSGPRSFCASLLLNNISVKGKKILLPERESSQMWMSLGDLSDDMLPSSVIYPIYQWRGRCTTLILQKKMLVFCTKWYQQNYLLVKHFILCGGITQVFCVTGLKHLGTREVLSLSVEGLAANGSEWNKVFISNLQRELKAEFLPLCHSGSLLWKIQSPLGDSFSTRLLLWAVSCWALSLNAQERKALGCRVPPPISTSLLTLQQSTSCNWYDFIAKPFLGEPPGSDDGNAQPS